MLHGFRLTSTASCLPNASRPKNTCFSLQHTTVWHMHNQTWSQGHYLPGQGQGQGTDVQGQGQGLDLQGQGHNVRDQGQGQEHEELSSRCLESKAIASRTPSPCIMWPTHRSCAFSRNASIHVVPQICISNSVLPRDCSLQISCANSGNGTGPVCGLTASKVSTSYNRSAALSVLQLGAWQIKGNPCVSVSITHTPQSQLKLAERTACLGQFGCDVAVCWNSAEREAANVAKLEWLQTDRQTSKR